MSDAQIAVQKFKELEAARKDCIAALKEKEVTAPENMPFKDLASYIEKIGA